MAKKKRRKKKTPKEMMTCKYECRECKFKWEGYRVLPEPEEDTWYWQDLLGLDVFDHKKGFIGKITDIFPTGANDMLVVMDKTRETLIPMHKHFVEAIDIEKNTVTTTLPPELLPDY